MRKKVLNQLISSAYFSGMISLFTSLSAVIWIPSALINIGIEEYSIYVKFSIFFHTGLAGILLLGYQSTALKFSADYWANHPHKIKPLYKLVVKRLVSSTIVAQVILILTSKYILQFLDLKVGDINIFLLTLIFLPFQFLNILNLNFLNGRKEFRLTQRIVFLQEALKLILILFLINEYASYRVIIISFLISQIVGLVISSMALIKRIKFLKYEKLNIKEVVTVQDYQKQLAAQNIISSIYNNSDKFLGSIFLTPGALGALDIILKLPQLINKGIFTTISGIIPVIGPENDGLEKYYKTFFQIFSTLCLGLALITFTKADFIYTTWLKTSYQPYYGEISKDFAFWIAILPILFPGSFIISKNYKIKYTTVFRALQATIKVILLMVIFRFFDVSLTPYAYLVSLLPGLILFKPIKDFGVKYFESFSIYLKSILWISPMFIINFLPTQEYLIFIFNMSYLGISLSLRIINFLKYKTT